MLEDYTLVQMNEELKELRANTRVRIKGYEKEISRGYDQHGIIYTSTARSLQASIVRLKDEVKAEAKKRNEYKKSLSVK